MENYLEWDNDYARRKDLIRLWHVQYEARRIRHVSKEVGTFLMKFLLDINLFNQEQEDK